MKATYEASAAGVSAAEAERASGVDLDRLVRDVSVGSGTFRTLDTGGDGPCVLLLHGFPELGYSWRHQLSDLASAGYRAIAPDQRGYGSTTASADVDECTIVNLCDDVVHLLDAMDIEETTVVGHDWGAMVAWHAALLHPQRVRAVGALSVPYTGRTPIPPMEFFRHLLGDDFYMLWLQEPGVADAQFAADVPRAMAGGWVVDSRHWRDGPTPARPAWHTSQDHDVYVEALTRRGFTGPLNWYRNFDRNWELMANFDGVPVDQPSLFIAGSDDPVGAFMPAAAMEGLVTDVEFHSLPGVNHWPQQEQPELVNRLLIDFLDRIHDRPGPSE